MTKQPQLVEPGKVRVWCKKCDDPVVLDFGPMSYETAELVCAKLNQTSRECVGFHVELSGWRELWSLDEALALAYPQEHLLSLIDQVSAEYEASKSESEALSC